MFNIPVEVTVFYLYRSAMCVSFPVLQIQTCLTLKNQARQSKGCAEREDGGLHVLAFYRLGAAYSKVKATI